VAPTDVYILVRISIVQSRIDFRLLINPWQLYLDNNFQLRGGAFFNTTIVNLPPNSPRVPPEVLSDSSSSSSTDSSSPSGSEEEFQGIGERAIVLNFSQTIERGNTGRRNLYEHKELGSDIQIRLLNLLPGEDGDVLRGTIRHISLDKLEPYEALSYRWGEGEASCELSTPEGLILISRSLYGALERLRHRERDRMLWIDAICIQQGNEKEKGEQLPLMATIYNSATLVIAYLGPAADNSSLALQTLRQIKTKADMREYWPEGVSEVPLSWKDGSIPPADDKAWSAVTALFDREWFRRMWVIQEVVVATAIKVVCGEWMVDWDELDVAVYIADREVKSAGEEYRVLDDTFKIFMILAEHRFEVSGKADYALHILLEKFCYAEATHQNDRIFALLNLAGDQDLNLIDFVPNYKVDFETIVLHFACCFVRQKRALLMLYSAGLSLTRNQHLYTSWTPDWTIKTRGTLFNAIVRGVPQAPEIDIPFSAAVQVGAPDVLVLTDAFLVDEVIIVSATSNTRDTLPQYFEEVRHIIQENIGIYPSGEAKLDLEWKVPIADAQFPEVASFNPLDLEGSYNELMVLLREGHSPYVPVNRRRVAKAIRIQSALAACKDYLSALQGTFLDWRFVVTRRGYVGIVPNLTQVGDVVTLLGGSKVAFLFRTSNTKEGIHRLVGACYIHGIGSEYLNEGERRKIRLH
jgi:hypothetical protein